MIMNRSKWIRILAGGMLMMVMALGAFTAFAQTADDPEATPVTPTTEDGTDSTEQTVPTSPSGERGHGLGVSDEALAEALGITVEEFQAAEDEARAAAVAQAVADGVLTQEQADAIIANGSSRGYHFSYDKNTYLAEALGITVEELEAAKLEVYTAQLDEMVAAGTITQEEADLILAQKAVQSYVDNDAYQAAVQSLYEDAVSQALADGAITQAQADALLANLANQSFGFPGFGGPGGGHHGHGGHGGPGGFNGAPDGSTTPSDSTTTDTASNA